MKICLAYVVVSNGPVSIDYAARFAATYHEYPPDYPHDTIILCNGGPVRLELALVFTGLKAKLLPRPNDPGFDVSAYIEISRKLYADYDAMFCCGESVYFHRAGWLKRLAQVWDKFGPGMYGPLSSNALSPHLNTTAFLCPPSLLRQYPENFRTRSDRYEFEHGKRSIWRRAVELHLPVRLVTWDGEWEPQRWREPDNILWRGDQSNCLVWETHTDSWFHADAAKKANWSRLADQRFR